MADTNLNKWKKRLTVVFFFIGLCALVCVSVYLLQILATPVAIILWTMIFVFLLKGIVKKLQDKGLNRVFGTIIAYIIMVAVIAVVILFMCSPVFGFTDQIRDIVENIPKYVTMISDWARDMYSQYGHYLNNPTIQKWVNDASASLSSIGGNIASASANGIIAAGGFLGNMFMSIGIALVIAFWILVELPAIGHEAKKFVKPKYDEDATMWHISFSHVMAGFIKGTFFQCLIIGFVSGIVFWIFGVPNPGALGCIVGVLNIIPIFGPVLAAGVALIGGLFADIWIGVLMLVIVSAIQGFVYTFVSPKIMSNSCNIHPVLTLLCLTAGGAIGGVMGGPIGSLAGMLLAIPFVAVFKSLFVYYYEKCTNTRIVSENGFLFKGIPYEEDKANPLFDALSIKKGKEPENLKKYC